MAVVRNLVANSLNQGVSFLVNIVTVPIYFALLGAEQYGLVGFAVVVQMWVSLLEFGMSGTLGREMTRLVIGDVNKASVQSFLRSLDWLFLGLALVLPATAWIFRDFWARHWFTNTTLNGGLISQCIVLIIALAAVRVAGTLYRGGLMGEDRQVFVSAVSIGSSVLRLGLPLPLALAIPDVRIVLGVWLLISLVELAVFRLALSQAFPDHLGWRHFSLNELRHRARFWGSIGYLSLTWTAITQTDKLVLSRVLSLADYGQFTLVMILSNAILTVATPISFAFQPKITAAATRTDRKELARLVRNATRMLMVLMIAPAIALAAAPTLAIYAWTGKPAVAAATSVYLGPYVLGSAMVSFAGIAYAIQYGFGDLKLHIRAYTLLAVILVPAEVVIASRFGPLGAAWLWFTLNAAVLVAYCPIVFHRFLPGEAARWYGIIILPPALASAAAAWSTASIAAVHANNRMDAVFGIAGIGLVACGAAAVVTLILSLIFHDDPFRGDSHLLSPERARESDALQ